MYKINNAVSGIIQTIDIHFLIYVSKTFCRKFKFKHVNRKHFGEDDFLKLYLYIYIAMIRHLGQIGKLHAR